jgi:uncharacterized membrane protein
MSTKRVSHDGLDRVVDGFSNVKTSLPRLYRNGPIRLFLIVTLAVAAATVTTGLWVQSIDGANADDWLAARLLFVVLVLGITWLLSALAAKVSMGFAGWATAWRAAREDERLVELAKSDYRLADEIRVFRSRNS